MSGLLQPKPLEQALLRKLIRSQNVQGNVYVVIPAADANVSEFTAKHLFKYPDGTESVVNTITAALANVVSGRGDAIYLMPGDYDEGAVINITKDNVTLLGPGAQNQHTALILSSDASHHLLYVDADHVTIDGVGFTQTKDTYDGIRIAVTASTNKTIIRNCRFDGYGAGEHAIKTDGADGTYDGVDVTVEDCRFQSWQTAGIYHNATRATYRRNFFHGVAAKPSIQVIPTTSSRPGLRIVDNDFLGVNSTDTGILISNAPGAGTYFVARNLFAGTATTITQKANNAYGVVNNYVSDGSGGALIDPVA